MTQRFALAPMSTGIRLLTWGLLALPVVFLALGLRSAQSCVLAPVGGLIAGLYLAVALWWRPSAFEIAPEGLRVRFPGRSRLVPRADLAGARTMDSAQFCAEHGLALRIGVGGLWGGFGWLWTRRRGLLDFYISRTDGLVLVERRSGRPLLITPADPDAFTRALADA